MLPPSGSAKAHAQSFGQLFTETAGQIANYGVEILRRTIGSFMSSLTALSSAANAFFAQMVAVLSTGRAVHDSAAMFGEFWPVCSPQGTASYSSPAMHAYGNLFPASQRTLSNVNPWMINPWHAFAQALESWTAIWALPFSAAGQRTYTGPARSTPQVATFSAPGFMFGFAWYPGG
jgi:hypothetical protein